MTPIEHRVFIALTLLSTATAIGLAIAVVVK